MRRSLAVLLVALPALAAGACEDPVRPAELLSGSIVNADTTLFVGDTATVEAIVERRSGLVAPDSLVWSVSNTKAVHLVPRAEGRATLEAVSRGTAYVVARIEGIFVDSTEVQVVREGDVRWRAPLPEGVLSVSGPALGGPLGGVYVTGGEDWLLGFTRGGEPLLTTPTCAGRLSPSVSAAGFAYGSSITCTRRHGPLGGVRWTSSAWNFDGGLAVAADGAVLILYPVPHENGSGAGLSRISPGGEELWRTVLGPITGDFTQTSAPAIGADGMIYVVWNESFPGPNWLSRVTPDGSVVWTVAAYGRMYGASPALVDGRVITTGREAGLAAYDTSGTQLWARSWSGSQAGISSPVVDEAGDIYVQTDHPSLRSYGPGGDLRWEAPELDCLDCGFGVGAPTLLADGTLLVQCWAGQDAEPGAKDLCAVRRSDGTLVWRSNVPGSHLYGAPAVAPDGTIFIGDGTGELLALWGRTPPLDEGWPTAGGGMGRLGRRE